jgi:hypothetical protein
MFISRDKLILCACSFADFFETPVVNSAAPQAFGFDGFFKGAFSYHFHNFWSANTFIDLLVPR